MEKWKNNKKTSKIEVEINDIVFIRITPETRYAAVYCLPNL